MLPSEHTPTSSRKRLGGPSHSFVLPNYYASLERALSEDAIYDRNTHAKLIRKSCEHLDALSTATKEREELLASLLLERAPLNLSDPSSTMRKKGTRLTKE